MIGVSVPQLDIRRRPTGTAKYGIDVMLPGMVYGKVVMPPVRYGATVKSVDDGAAMKVRGLHPRPSPSTTDGDERRAGWW